MAKILIVDDEALIRNLLAAAFQMAGFDVWTAQDGAEAVGVCDTQCFDAVLSDIVMPRMNGHDLVRWVNEHQPMARTVLMSGYDMGCEGCPKAQGCVRLSKPFLPSEAVSLITSLIAAPV